MRTPRVLVACVLLAAGGSLSGASLVGAPALAVGEDCPAPDNRPTVRFLDYDSGVENRTVGGCSINDLVDDERAWSNHGSFVRHVRPGSASSGGVSGA